MTTQQTTAARVLDIRNIIAGLLGIYGTLLIIAGLVPDLVIPTRNDTKPTGNTIDLYIGTAANWWVGLALLGVAAGFILWAALRPPVTGAEVPPT